MDILRVFLHGVRDAIDEVLKEAERTEGAAPPSPSSPSMLGRWAPWYSSKQRLAHHYGPPTTYVVAEEWLAGLSVEDWGCGYAQFKGFHQGGYWGVDGTPGWCDEVADLTIPLRGKAPEGLLLRHVLEHNTEWRMILRNAVDSFQKRMVLVVFTPDSGGREEKKLAHVDEVNVDDLSLPFQEIESFFSSCRVVKKQFFETPTGYGGETVWLVEK